MAELIKKYPSPISELTRLAQAVHETGNFKSDIFKNANNSFGIKASAPWTGETYNAKTGEHFDGKDVIVRDNFRKYKTAEDSVADQALFFVSTDHRKNVAYKEAIEAPNYIEEGKALMGPGKYATDVPSANSIGYAAKLLRTIDNYNLKSYGMKESASLKDIEGNKETPKEESKGEDKNMAFPKPAMVDRRKQALGYPGHGVYSKRNKSAIKNIVWHYTATTHAGDGMGIIKRHEDYWKSAHKWEIGGYAYYIDRQGKIFWNYDLEIVTYGAGVVNPTTMHISCEASSAANYTEAQKKSREALTLWLLSDPLKHLNGLSMRGHNEFMNTTCPGYNKDQLNAYRNDLNKKLKEGAPGSGISSPAPSANSVVWPKYKAPTQPFKTLKVGDKVTIRKGQSAWFIPNNPKVGTKPSKDFAGDKDVITKVMDVNVGYSKKAYLLKDKISWILEQDLENARDLWKETVEAKFHTVKSGEYLYLIGEKYGVTVAQIKEWNRLLTNVIYTGQKLYVEDPSQEALIPSQPAPPEKEETIEAPSTEQPKDEGNETPAVELKDGEFMWAGIKYKIIKEEK